MPKPAQPTPAPAPAPGEATPVVAPAPADIKDFKPEPSSYKSGDPDGLDTPLELTPAPAPAPAPVPPVAKELSPEDKKKLNADLRVQLELANKSKAEIEDTMKKTVAEKEAEVERLRKEREDLDQRLKQRDQQYTELNRTVSMERPELSEEVQEIIRPWNQKMDRLAERVTVAGGDGEKFKAELGQMIAAARGATNPQAEGFQQNRERLNAMVDAYDPAVRSDVMSFVLDGIEVQTNARKKMAEMTDNAQEFRRAREMQHFKAIVQDYEKDEQSFFNPAPELKENDPFNAEVLVTELLKGSDAGKKRMEDIKKFARFAMLPLPPIGDEIKNMSDEDAAAYAENRLRNHQAASVRLRRLFPVGQAAMALLPSLVKRNKELEDQIATLRGNSPAPKLENTDGLQSPAESNSDVKTFTPTNPILDEIKAENRRR